jgi:hypothetical protein
MTVWEATLRIKSSLRGNVMGMFGALSVFGRRIKGMIRLRTERVWTCNVTRHHRPLLSLLYIRDASGSRNKMGTPWCRARRILSRHEARDESSDPNFVSCQSLATLRRYGTRYSYKCVPTFTNINGHLQSCRPNLFSTMTARFTG